MSCCWQFIALFYYTHTEFKYSSTDISDTQDMIKKKCWFPHKETNSTWKASLVDIIKDTGDDLVCMLTNK